MGKKSKRAFSIEPSKTDPFGNPLSTSSSQKIDSKASQENKSQTQLQKVESSVKNEESSRDIKVKNTSESDLKTPSIDHFEESILSNTNTTSHQTEESGSNLLQNNQFDQSDNEGFTEKKFKRDSRREKKHDQEYKTTKTYTSADNSETKTIKNIKKKDFSSNDRGKDDKFYSESKKQGSKIEKDQKSKKKDYDEQTETKHRYNREDWSSSKRDFGNKSKSNPKMQYEEMKGNLFDAPESFSLAHCVAEDLQMGAGIAVEFRDRFKKTGYLADLNVKTGGVAVLENKGRYIYYLITKKLSKGKPTMETLKSSLLKMAEHVEQNNVREIAMPTIGCGLDRLDWGSVLETIKDVFHNIDVYIRVYQFDRSAVGENNVTRNKSTYVKHIQKELALVESGTALLYLSNISGSKSVEMSQLNSRYPFYQNYDRESKKLGKVIRIISKDEVTYGLVCKENNKILFSELETCLENLSIMIVRDKYEHVGIQAFSSEDMDMHLIITLLKHIMPNHVTVWICWKDLVPNDFYEYK